MKDLMGKKQNDAHQASFIHIKIKAPNTEMALKMINASLKKEKSALKKIGLVLPIHLIFAQAKKMTGKWFRWRITDKEYTDACMELYKMFNTMY